MKVCYINSKPEVSTSYYLIQCLIICIYGSSFLSDVGLVGFENLELYTYYLGD